MSAVSRIMVFPEGLSAQEVLAVDLDEDSVDYFSTYPGTAKWLPNPERLREDLAKVGKKPEHVPEAVPGLLENLQRGMSLTREMGWVLSGLAAGLTPLFFTIYGPESLPLLVRFIIGLAVGIATPLLVKAPLRKKRRASVAYDEQLKRIYHERLDEVGADHLVSIDDPDADDVRKALAHADAIHANLKLIRRYGLSTLEESEAVDEHLAPLLRAYIAEQAAQPRLKRFEAVLRDVDRKTIAADADLQNIQQLKEELSHTTEAAREKASAAMSELDQLEKETTTTVRRTEAKLQAAELTGQEGTEL